MKRQLLSKAMLLLCALIVGVSSAWAADTETLTFPSSTSSVDKKDSGISVSGTDVSVSITKGTGTNLATNTDGSRVYQGNSIVFSSSTKKIAKIVFAYNRNSKQDNGITANVGSFTTAFTVGNSSASDQSATWEASNSTTTEVTFTVGSGKGNYALKSAVVTFVEEAPAFTITPQSNNDSYGTVSLSGVVITGSPKSGYRYASPAYTVEPAGSATVVQDGNAFTVTPSANTTVTINFEAIPTHTAHFSVNGTIDDNDDDTVAEGAAITFPSDPADINGKTFVGWVSAPIVGTTNTKPSFVTVANETMSTSDVTYYAVFATAEGSAETKQDVLTRATTGVTSGTTTYGSWSGKTATSAAVYAGNSAGGNDAIQLRWDGSDTSKRAGVITTASGGKAKKVTVAWQSNTANDRTLNVYGKNTAYSSYTDLQGDNKGTLLGTIVKGTSTELSITGDYGYIGFCSASGAMYLTSVTIDWEVSNITYSAYATTVSSLPVPTITFKNSDDEAITSLDITAQDMAEVSVVCSAGDVTLTVTSNDATVAEYDEGYVMAYKYGTATLTATFGGNESYQGTSATLTVNVAKITTTTSVEVDIDNTDVYTATDGGLAVATVKAGSSTVTPAAVTWTSSEPSVATINADGEITLVGAGTTTITASYAGTDVYEASEGTYELTLTTSKPQETSVSITLNNTFFGCDAFTSYASGAPTSYEGNKDDVKVTYAKGTGSGFYCNTTGIRLYSGGTLTFEAPTGYVITKIVLAGEDGFESGLTNPSASTTWTGSSASVVVTGESKNGSNTRKNMTGATVTLAPVVAISDAGWATYCSAHALDFTNVDGLTAYTAKKDGDAVKFTKVTGKVRANTGLLVSGVTTSVPVATGDVPAVGTNLLEGVLVNTEMAAGAVFVLLKGDKGLGFYKNTNAFTVRANSAYLPAEAVAGARTFVGFDGDTDPVVTGINAVHGEEGMALGDVFDLQGRKVSQPTKGLYIVNGKKVVIN